MVRRSSPRKKPTRVPPSTDTPPRSGSGLAAVVLAAGEGTRMMSVHAKVLHEISGRPLVEHVVRAALAAGACPVVVVVGVQGDLVRARVERALPGAPLRFVEQTERRGTADAVRRAVPALSDFQGTALILCGDVPALPAEAVAALANEHLGAKAALTVLTAMLADPQGYGRIVRGKDGRIRAIVEERDANATQRRIREINTGTYCADWPVLVEALAEIKPDNAQQEYYLTDAVRLLLARRRRVHAVVHDMADEALGVNSRRQLALLQRAMNERVLGRLMDSGVTVIDPASTWVHDTVTVGSDTVLHPGVTLEGSTTIGRGCVVRSGARLTDCRLGDAVEIKEYTIAAESSVGDGSAVGPFAHLRPGTALGAQCKVGNFVETKKAVFGEGSKASHLSYIGDAELGRDVNIGAGTITCNYDGVFKNKTVLGDGVFIGSDTQLVAPVTVGAGAYVGAGTTVTQDVPADALAITRVDQRNIEGWAEKRREKMAALKAAKSTPPRP